MWSLFTFELLKVRSVDRLNKQICSYYIAFVIISERVRTISLFKMSIYDFMNNEQLYKHRHRIHVNFIHKFILENLLQLNKCFTETTLPNSKTVPNSEIINIMTYWWIVIKYTRQGIFIRFATFIMAIRGYNIIYVILNICWLMSILTVISNNARKIH